MPSLLRPNRLFALVLLLPFLANATSLPNPDPPGTIVFQSITLQKVQPSEPKVSPSCDARYKASIENSFQNLWTTCGEIGAKESSDCQRSFFLQCTGSANSIRNLQPSTCSVIETAAATIGSTSATTLNQSESQVENSSVNERSARAARTAASKLKNDATQASLAAQKLKFLLANPACARSSALGEYAALNDKAQGILNQLKIDLEALAAEKEALAKGYDNTKTASDQNKESLASDRSSQGNSQASPWIAGNGDKAKNSWMPAAAVAAPLALAGIMIAGDSKNGAGWRSSGSGGNFDGPGETVLNNHGLRVDTAFTDEEKAVIAASVATLPECRRSKLRGLIVQRKDLSNHRLSTSFKAGQCIAGLWEGRGEQHIVSLDAKCSPVSMGVTVHEFMHSLGHRNGGSMHHQYRTPFSQNPNCPVTPYGATSFYEDFAESGRLVSVQDGGVNVQGCVGTKLGQMKQIVTGCQ